MKLAPFGILGMAMAAFAAHAEPLVIPTPEQAHAAVLTLLGDDLPGMKTSQLAIGTCLPAPAAQQKGRVSCTTMLLMPAGTSEAPMDFYLDSGKWIASPPTNLELPFPDPKLANKHWDESKARK
ncbi:hypothetical protein RAS12_04890 [Achromobacter seleniivolatilans]|uniref:Lipoprotein n=1 Tax=Achromobacter seleniivolatilans TaxID=3047478 RepID=A0ABY9M4U1_9BURK|nr:hypothetical protein [Achromobacter sp. R39]WMD21717.1 hypothetical protein RAS12_04890 [Achromobacter sp. R39]